MSDFTAEERARIAAAIERRDASRARAQQSTRTPRIGTVAIDIAEHPECGDAYIVDVTVAVGAHNATGRAIVTYSPEHSRWVRLAGHTPYWLSEQLVSFAFRCGVDPTRIADAVEHVAAELADRHDASTGGKLLERALERDAHEQSGRREAARERDGDRRMAETRGK